MPIIDPNALDNCDVGNILPQIFARQDDPLKKTLTGWKRLDKFLNGGFEVPSFAILGAEPKAGKSRWAQLVAEHHVENGGVAYYLDEENGRQRVWGHSLASKAELGTGKLTALLSKEEHERRQKARDWAMKMKGRFYYDDTRTIRTPEEFRGRIAQVRERAGSAPLFVVCDSLQKLPVDLANRRAGIDKWLREIEAIRDENKCVILALSELTRPDSKLGEIGYGTARGVRFKESGDAEYTADISLLMTKIRPGGKPNWDDPTAKWTGPDYNMVIDYNRDGAAGNVASYCMVFQHYGMVEGDFIETLRKKKEDDE